MNKAKKLIGLIEQKDSKRHKNIVDTLVLEWKSKLGKYGIRFAGDQVQINLMYQLTKEAGLPFPKGGGTLFIKPEEYDKLFEIAGLHDITIETIGGPEESHYEDLWKASQPGFGDGAKTQLIPEQKMVHILYPEDRWVSPEKIMLWAKDAYADGEIDHEPEDLEDAIEMLQDAGIITVPKKWWVEEPYLKEDLWPASKPGFPPGVSATTQLVPEQEIDKGVKKELKLWKKIGYNLPPLTISGQMLALRDARDKLDPNDPKEARLIDDINVLMDKLSRIGRYR